MSTIIGLVSTFRLPLQIHHTLASLLDFLPPSLRSNVQSTMLWLPFLTFCYACITIRNTDTTNTLKATHF